MNKLYKKPLTNITCPICESRYAKFVNKDGNMVKYHCFTCNSTFYATHFRAKGGKR